MTAPSTRLTPMAAGRLRPARGPVVVAARTPACEPGRGGRDVGIVLPGGKVRPGEEDVLIVLAGPAGPVGWRLNGQGDGG